MTLSAGAQLLLGVLLSHALMTALYWVAERRRDASHADVGWAWAIAGMAAFIAATSNVGAHGAFVATLALLWGGRLGFFLLVDRVVGKPEDGRYQELRRAWGAQASRNFFWLFQLQAVAAMAFVLPIQLAIRAPDVGFGAVEWIGGGIWLAALAGEALADRQLAAFKRRPDSRGKTCRDGLWRYSRHPNYFFEWIHWFAYVVLAWNSPWWWLALVGPAAMGFLLTRVTGIPATEAQALRSRGDDYRDYQRTTSAFFPWFPRSEAAAKAGS